MPTLAKFKGITIRMYFFQHEHNPPHIHAIFGDSAAAVDIQTQDILDGSIPPKALAAVRKWLQEHQSELLGIWEKQIFSGIDSDY